MLLSSPTCKEVSSIATVADRLTDGQLVFDTGTLDHWRHSCNGQSDPPNHRGDRRERPTYALVPLDCSTQRKTLISSRRYLEDMYSTATKLRPVQALYQGGLYMGGDASLPQVDELGHQDTCNHAFHLRASNLGCRSWLRLHCAVRA